MADNVVLDPGVGGDTIAADDVGGAKHQQVKVEFGADGTATPVDASNPLPVTAIASALPTGAATAARQDTGNTSLATIAGAVAGSEVQVDVVTSALPTGAATLAEQQTQTASLSVIDDWDESDRAKVNPIVGQAGIAAGTGVDGATVPRVTLATNVPLPAGTNAIGKLAANSGVDIGDVDVTSCALPTGAATLAEQQTQTASLSVLDDWDETNRAAVNAIAGQVGVQGGAGAVTALTQRVSIATDANAVTAVGTIADDATTPGAPVMVGGMAKSPDGTDPGSVSAENDVARAITDLNRRVFVNTNHPRTLKKHLDGSTAYTDEEVVADPGDGFQTVITNIIASTGAATALNFFLEEGSTKIFGPIYLEAVAGRGFASGPIYLPVTASTAVTLTSSASIAQSFQFEYFIQAV